MSHVVTLRVQATFGEEYQFYLSVCCKRNLAIIIKILVKNLKKGAVSN